MERKAHVSFDFKALTPLDKVAFGNNAIAKLMAAGSTFPDLPVPMIDLTAANSTLNTTYQAYKQNGPNAKGAYLEADAIWDAMFGRTGEYVDLVADGTVSLINISGYKPTKTETTPSEIPGIPQNADVYGGREEGVVLASVDSMKGVKGYYFGMATPDFEVIQNGDQLTFKLGESFVTFIIGSQRKVEFTGLPSRKGMLVKAAGFNPAGLGAFATAVVNIP